MKFINICMERCYGPNVCVPQDLYTESLISDTLVFVDSTFESQLGYKDRAFMNGISALKVLLGDKTERRRQRERQMK